MKTKKDNEIKLLCIDDEGWMDVLPGNEVGGPRRGEVYTMREYRKIDGVGAVSLVEGHGCNFYRASRFRKVGTTAPA